jgi:hypothetical protein
MPLCNCMGYVVTEVSESAATGKRFSELMQATAKAPAGQRRLFAYRTAESTKYGLQINFGVTKNDFYCVVDDRAYHFVTEAYVQLNLAPGPHEISCHDVYYSKGGFIQKFGYRKGTEILPTMVRGGEDTYVRIDLINGRETPLAVNQAAALSEIANSRLMTEKSDNYIE